jgi:hypothetical protein
MSAAAAEPTAILATARQQRVPEMLLDCLRVLRWVTAESLAHRHSAVRTKDGLPKRIVRPRIRSVPGVIGERGARAELRLVRVAADLQQADGPIAVWP